VLTLLRSGHGELSPSPPVHPVPGCGNPLRMCQQGCRLSSRRWSVLLLRVGYRTPVVSRGLFRFKATCCAAGDFAICERLVRLGYSVRSGLRVAVVDGCGPGNCVPLPCIQQPSDRPTYVAPRHIPVYLANLILGGGLWSLPVFTRVRVAMGGLQGSAAGAGAAQE
jgi:hypothetical protein